MSYYFSKKINCNFEDAVKHASENLIKSGFGIITEIDMKATLKKKIDVDIKNYTILGACSPKHAYAAITSEDKIGLMLPCNVIVQQLGDNECEIAAIDPIESMMAVQNENLAETAIDIQNKLKTFIESL